MIKKIVKPKNNNLVIFIDNEVLAEVVFVLLKVYKIPKDEIRTSLENFYLYQS